VDRGNVSTVRAASLPLRVAVVGAAIACSTGAGLVAYFLSGFLSGLSLPLGWGSRSWVTGTVGVLVWRCLDQDRQPGRVDLAGGHRLGA